MLSRTLDRYYACDRPEMLKFIPPDAKRLLDVGCAGGAFGAAIKEMLPECEVWGIEPQKEPAVIAASRLHKVYNDIFSRNLDVPHQAFDAITMTDVLEHIYDTDGTLQLTRDLLAPGGRLILSLPNVQFYVHCYNQMMKGEWEYQDDGLLDRTHVRFFTASSAKRTLERNGFVVERMEGLPGNPPAGKWKLLFAMFPKRLYWARFLQFAVVARPD
jgi:2-polyprenyl-3-methyl-5-hydroxy-6-metoxy-1,4-benzoquinol methylase